MDGGRARIAVSMINHVRIWPLPLTDKVSVSDWNQRWKARHGKNRACGRRMLSAETPFWRPTGIKLAPCILRSKRLNETTWIFFENTYWWFVYREMYVHGTNPCAKSVNPQLFFRQTKKEKGWCLIKCSWNEHCSNKIKMSSCVHDCDILIIILIILEFRYINLWSKNL